MGDDDNGLAKVVNGRAKSVEDLLGGGGVQVACRLVAEDEIGAGDKRAGASDALLLVAGQLR